MLLPYPLNLPNGGAKAPAEDVMTDATFIDLRVNEIATEGVPRLDPTTDSEMMLFALNFINEWRTYFTQLKAGAVSPDNGSWYLKTSAVRRSMTAWMGQVVVPVPPKPKPGDPNGGGGSAAEDGKTNPWPWVALAVGLAWVFRAKTAPATGSKRRK